MKLETGNWMFDIRHSMFNAVAGYWLLVHPAAGFRLDQNGPPAARGGAEP
jgi:hypothetical protein